MIKDEFDYCLKENNLLSKSQQKINHIIDLLLNLCKKHWTFDSRGEEWLRFLDFTKEWLDDGLKSIKGKEFCDDFEEFLRNLFYNIFAEFSTNVSLQLIQEVFLV